jgi:hypothetical protein
LAEAVSQFLKSPWGGPDVARVHFTDNKAAYEYCEQRGKTVIHPNVRDEYFAFLQDAWDFIEADVDAWVAGKPRLVRRHVDEYEHLWNSTNAVVKAYVAELGVYRAADVAARERLKEGQRTMLLALLPPWKALLAWEFVGGDPHGISFLDKELSDEEVRLEQYTDDGHNDCTVQIFI